MIKIFANSIKHLALKSKPDLIMDIISLTTACEMAIEDTNMQSETIEILRKTINKILP